MGPSFYLTPPGVTKWFQHKSQATLGKVIFQIFPVDE